MANLVGKSKCALCGGTGWLLYMNSWFIRDGLRREQCGICGETGGASYRPDPEWVANQKRFRHRCRVEIAVACAASGKGGEE